MSLISIIITLLIFTVIVVIHEAGHMVVAKKCKVLVTEFAVGMGPKIWGFKKGDTEYNIRILPLGGFCRMEEEVEGRTDVISLNDATPLQKILICFAGPFMNFVLALIIMIGIGLCTYITTTTVTYVYDNSPAQEAGIEVGDKIVEVNGHSTHIKQDIDFYRNGGTTPDNVVVKRNGERIEMTITPYEKDGSYIYGVGTAVKAPYFDVLNLNENNTLVKGELWEYIVSGFWSVLSIVNITVISFVRLITAKIAVTELSGPIGVTSAVGEVYTQAVEYGMGQVVISMLDLTVLLSANLGVLNLFPLPALDGGRIVVAFVELIARRRVPPNIEGFIHFIGFVLLMALGIYIAFNDVIKLL